MPIPKKVEAIQALTVPKTRKQLCQFIGMINFYRDMRQKRSKLLAPLTALTSKNVKYDWKDEHPNFTIQVITSLVRGLCPYLRNSRQFKPSQLQKTRKQLRQFIGMINFYRDMWQKCFELLAPLTALTSKNVKYDWKDEHQKCFDAIKRVIGREVLLGYPDFNALFEIHTDASKLQLGAVISQKGKPIAFYSRKMNSA